MKLLKGLLVLGVWLVAHVQAEEAASPHVYMVASSKITGTTYSQLVFFRSDEINTLAQCEEERTYGLTSGWRIYTHLTRKTKGFGYSVQYFCAESELRMSLWQASVKFYNKVYLLELKEQQLGIKLMDSYAACVKTQRGLNPEAGVTVLCGKSNQRVIKPLVY